MFSSFAIGDFSTVDLLIILAVVLLLFGGKKLPELSRSLGTSMKELRNGMKDAGDEKKTKSENSQTSA
jgi:sec-independent protein translocase protein TatA